MSASLMRALRIDPGNPFHDGPTLHSHQGCAYCYKIQRCEFTELRACAGCGTVRYCSKECQVDHWAQHKPTCKAVQEHNKNIQEKTNIKCGYTDAAKWVEFYSTPIKNCLVAALDLPHSPHQEQHSAIVIQITHTGNQGLPTERRFEIVNISRHDRGQSGLTSAVVAKWLDSEEMQRKREFGKVEMGKEYYGTGMFMVVASFLELGRVAIPISKFFAIDKDTARANVAPGAWWLPLRRILEKGEKLKFCCGKLDVDICCCGGWLHGEDIKKGDI